MYGLNIGCTYRCETVIFLQEKICCPSSWEGSVFYCYSVYRFSEGLRATLYMTNLFQGHLPTINRDKTQTFNILGQFKTPLWRCISPRVCFAMKIGLPSFPFFPPGFNGSLWNYHKNHIIWKHTVWKTKSC